MINKDYTPKGVELAQNTNTGSDYLKEKIAREGTDTNVESVEMRLQAILNRNIDGTKPLAEELMEQLQYIKAWQELKKIKHAVDTCYDNDNILNALHRELPNIKYITEEQINKSMEYAGVINRLLDTPARVRRITFLKN